MDIETEMTDKLGCSTTIVVRWHPNADDLSPTCVEVQEHFQRLGFNTTRESERAESLIDPKEVLFLRMSSESEVTRIMEHSAADSYCSTIGRTTISINRLIEPNGLRLRDAVDFLRLQYVSLEHDMDLLLGLTRLELPERSEMANSEYEMIRKGIERLVENGECITFGSFSSPIRRNGYSDIDICVELDTNKSDSGSIRPLQEVIDNPKCLLTSPLTSSEFYSYPAVEIIKALAHCFQETTEFRERFRIRAALPRTPIIIFKSNKNGMEMSYDVSVNNLVSVEKTQILNLFITKDKSERGKTRKVLMFIVFWAKTNRLINGTYEDERLEVKTGLWSYIINQLVFHFLQVAAEKELLRTGDNRVIEYNFDELFEDYTSFFRQFFQYYADFDYVNNAIQGRRVIKKEELGGFEKTPFMLIDPMDATHKSHNVSSHTTEKALELLEKLCRNAVVILENKIFRLDSLLEVPII